MIYDILKNVMLFPKRSDKFCVGIGNMAVEIKTQVFDSTIAGGSATHTISATGIPGNALILGVSLIVKEAITGGLATFSVGYTGQTARYGTGLAKTVGTALQVGSNLTASIEKLMAATALILTADASTFSGGRVRAVVYSMPMDTAL
jgi:hypothetical protein